jgi:hypothetical protein
MIVGASAQAPLTAAPERRYAPSIGSCLESLRSAPVAAGAASQLFTELGKAGPKCWCSGSTAVLDEDGKVAGHRTIFLSAVVVVAIRPSMEEASIWAAAGLPDHRRE